MAENITKRIADGETPEFAELLEKFLKRRYPHGANFTRRGGDIFVTAHRNMARRAWDSKVDFRAGYKAARGEA
jgi:hypothetical protein